MRPPPPGLLRHTARHQGQGTTWLDVFPHDGDVAVSVWSCVFVPEADDMTQFVDNDAELVTVLADRDGLWAPATATHVGAAPGGRGQLRGAVPSWGSASTQGPGEAARGAGERGAGEGPEHGMPRLCAGVIATSGRFLERCPRAGVVGGDR